MKALIVDTSSEKPVMKLDDHPKPTPKPNELLVKIEATALNRADLLQKRGNYPVPEGASEILGLEMSGRVEKTGEEVIDFEEGDLLFGLLSGGGYAEYCVIPEDHAIPMPDSLSFEEAAGISETFLTAYQGLFWIGEIMENETVLIHAGASGVGSSAIQLAKNIFNARVIVTAGSSEKLDLCRELGADLAINYKTEDFAAVIEEEMGPSTVDVILDFVGASYWEQNIRVLAMDGRLVLLGLLGGAKADSLNLGDILRKRLTIRGSTLRNRSDEYKALLTEEFFDAAFDLIESKQIKPVIDSVFDWKNVEKAHQRMKNNENAGKIILNGM
ncbi:NAD(P)H-quinone oxidoreductase [Rhodohalobacter sp. SW132]|uniref:NAD(P)H-quinone oxidoreductase n=1 Tax=Rhodohalobacter sp. SW132 TaxID=2293433 RepID=UPI000E22C287|nr:NAD(P)H-quinone oxidoreductase [Rhodohalobacter sp. SW132]REL24877.1 NAD(P)H-quinone oxidoreductase [Rhodohalobacter sp. SW132]